ncbi:MAG: pyridoxamine 5'-phosphate oxidase family protein, partial [Gemmatimonadales bacterium]
MRSENAVAAAHCAGWDAPLVAWLWNDAMALATVDQSGQPSVRMVLLKGVDDRGFVFYTNLESQKGRDL